MALIPIEQQNEFHRKMYDELAKKTITGRFTASKPHSHKADAVTYQTGYSTSNRGGGAHSHEVANPVYDINVIVQEAVDNAVSYLVSELDGMMQRCEELEIELECMQNAFPEHDHDVQPKRRGNFNNDY